MSWAFPLVLALAFWTPQALGEMNPLGEYQVKAAFVYNFAKYVQWPAESSSGAGAPFTVGVLGKSPIGDALGTIAGKLVRGRHIVVVELKHLEDIDSCNCSLIFVCNSERQRVREILARVGNRPILTVSDIKRFAEVGGMIGLVSVGENIKFEINHRAALRARLQMSSQLLKLATAVVE